MLGISLLIAMPISWAGHRLTFAAGRIQAVAGAFSCAFGVYLGLRLWLYLPLYECISGREPLVNGSDHGWNTPVAG